MVITKQVLIFFI